jgi:aspartate/methionine/tyrosine aminotransferase
MSDFDMMLARGVNDDWHNLALGEPHVLQRNLVLPSRKTTRGENEYPAPQGDPMLIKELQNLNPGMCVVVTNGAKQALSAALYALHDATNHGVYHSAPYWPSFPTLANLEHLGFVCDKPRFGGLYINILTRPNNPNGYVNEYASCDIWDAAYASDLYGFSANDEPNFKIKVESASKMFGLSGSRIGWALCYDAYTASKMSEYVELHTSGVNVPSQRKVAACLANLDKLQKGFDKARRELLLNAGIFHQELGGFVDKIEGVPSNGTGMFAWFTVFPDVAVKFKQALEIAKVRLINGEACGSPGWYRMSCAQDPDVTFQALRAIKEAICQRRNT